MIDTLRQVFIYIPAIVWFITALQFCSLIRRTKDKSKVNNISIGFLVLVAVAVLYFLVIHWNKDDLLEDHHRRVHWVNFILIMFAHIVSLFLKTLFSNTSLFFFINTFLLIVFVLFFLLTPELDYLLNHYFSGN